MSAESEKIREALSDQLSDLDDSLDNVGDVEMLADLQAGIGRLLADNGSVEAEIRAVLQERYESGKLRQETFQLVKSMLDRFVTEQLATTSPVSADPREGDLDYVPEPAADEFSSTTVLDTEPLRPPTAEDRVQVGSVLRDRFLLQERVSGGSMGVVYKALDRRLAEAGAESPWVAIKVLSPQLSKSGPALRALQQEAAKGRCLLHSNIVRFIDLDRDDDLYFIVMEWLEGRTLADILDSPDSKSVDRERSLEIVRQVGEALEYAHRCGIIHADVKPGNVMIAPDGSAKLFDFGVARVLQTQENGPGDFDPAALGALTPAYSSMQVLTGDEPVPSDDVFSLGCLMYRLVAGYRVFGPRNAAEAAEEGMKPQRIPALNDTEWAALKRAISYSRVTRFDSMRAFLDALEAPAPEAISVTAEQRVVEQEKSSSGGRGLLIVMSVLLVGGGMAAWQLGYLDSIRDELLPPPGEEIVDVPAEPELPIAAPPESEPLPEATDVETLTDEAPALELPVEPVETTPAIEPDPVTDFTTLPPADFTIELASGAEAARRMVVTLREDGGPVTVDLLRSNIDLPLTLRIEEVGHSGNRSPWTAEQYSLSEDIVSIPAGQDRARVELEMASDPLREADQQSTLRVREVDTATSELAILEVVLEDDDQRAFEAGLPTNTVAFAVSQVSVSERDPAVQVDILRFNPDSQPLVIDYVLRDVTATEGEDYFSTGGYTVEFGPGQRSARVLIPLVQDFDVEGDEAFTVELTVVNPELSADVYQRIVVMIRDDEFPRP
ncbi:MAG: protein kinase [Woeseiaceae bacterium]|nr:protein kinase [Woeseiaceae bacterium]